MRVAICCNAAERLLGRTDGRHAGGMQVRAFVLARALAYDRGHDVTFVVPDASAPRAYEGAGMDVVEWPHGGGDSWISRTTARALEHVRRTPRFPWMRFERWRWPLLWQLPVAALHMAMFTRSLRRGYSRRAARSARDLATDVVCCFKPGYLTASIVEGCRRAGRPVVVILSNDTDLGDHVYRDSREWGPKWSPGHASWRSIADADAVVVQTQWQQQRLRERFGREGVVIRNPMEMRTDTDDAPPFDTPYVLWVGRGDREHKRPRVCFELARGCPDTRFVMIMNPVDDALQAALKAEAPPNVEIIDHVPLERIEAYFKHTSLFVSTSAFEGFPNTFLQAGKYAVPIVTLSIDPDGFIAQHGCGVVCEGDVSRMTDTVTKLMHDPALRARYGQVAEHYVQTHHDLEGRVHEFEALLTTLVTQERSSRADGRRLMNQTPRRIALLTPEYVTESHRSTGGAAQAVHKFAHGLRALGHEVEVFVASRDPVGSVNHEGVRVHRVGYAVPWAVRRRTWRRRPGDLARSLALLGRPAPAINLADALAQRDAAAPFDMVMSMLLDASGVFVAPRAGRPHIVRVTSSVEQQDLETAQRGGLTERVVRWLWGRQVQAADVVIAPSELAARSIERAFGRHVEIVRTPAWREVEPATALPFSLPDRYLLHFGRISTGKGSEDIARALVRCWDEAPELRMVWAGKEAAPGMYARCAAHWQADEQRVQWLGPLDKATLYAVLRGAAATVLPSRMDNLPNTAIESLMFHVPVIGTRGTSLDELVEHGRSGELIEPADPDQLADAMLRMWRGESPCQRAGFTPPAVLDEMRPETAAQRLIALADKVKGEHADSAQRSHA